MSYFDKRIFEEWDALCFSSNPEMPVAEREQRARTLLASCTQDGKWSVSINNADLAAYHEVVCALQGGRYGEAVDCCQQFLSHPAIDLADEPSVEEFTVLLGTAYVLMGDVDTGLKTYTDLIEGRPKLKQHRRHLVRNNLFNVIRQLGESSPADERTLRFVSDLLREWKGQVRKGSVVFKARTYREVHEVLLSTYPKKSPVDPAY